MRTALLVAATTLVVLGFGALLAAEAAAWVRARRRREVQAALAALATRPPSARARRAVVLELADRLDGQALRATVPYLDEVLGEAERDVTSRRWVRRARGARTLATTHLDGARLLALLTDRDARVRALAASVAVGSVDARVCAAAVDLLDDEADYVRFAALDGLSRRGAGSGDALATALRATPVALADDTADARAVTITLPGPDTPGRSGTSPRPLRSSLYTARDTRRLLLLLRAATASADPTLTEPCRAFLTDARPDVRAAAVTACAALGTGVRDLAPLLDDVDGRVRTAAAQAWGRLGATSAAALLAPALGDRDHGVRQAAAASLHELGPAGRLLLAAATRGEDPYAADAARLALGLAPEAGSEPQDVTA